MSEPIELYTIDGELRLMFSPIVAEQLVDKGELFVSPPLVVETKKTVRTKRASRAK